MQLASINLIITAVVGSVSIGFAAEQCMVSQLNYDGGDYNVELYLGKNKTSENKGFFTVDSGSGNFIVNGADCTSALCKFMNPKDKTGPLKQFPNPPESEMKVADQSIGYGDHSGYEFNIYSHDVTIPTGQTVKNANVCYNKHAFPNSYPPPGTGKTDNFALQKQGIIGIAPDCSSMGQMPELLTSIAEDNMGQNTATMCLNGVYGKKSDDSKMAWGNALPEGMPTADFSPNCGSYKVFYDYFEVVDKDGKVHNTVPAAPLKPAPISKCGDCPNQNICNKGGSDEQLCVLAPMLDTGTSNWDLSHEDFSGLLQRLVDFYGPTSDVGKVIQGLLDKTSKQADLSAQFGKDFEALAKDNGNLALLMKAFNDNPVTIRAIFKGSGKPSLQLTVTGNVMSNIGISEDGQSSTLGQMVLNGNIVHFDRTNNKVGMKRIGSDGCNEPYFTCASDAPTSQQAAGSRLWSARPIVEYASNNIMATITMVAGVSALTLVACKVGRTYHSWQRSQQFALMPDGELGGEENE